jgi:hypothetical protein
MTAAPGPGVPCPICNVQLSRTGGVFGFGYITKICSVPVGGACYGAHNS